MKRFLLIFFFSLLNGGLNAFTFMVCVGGFPIKGVADEMSLTAAIIIGLFSGALLSPLAYWCLANNYLVIILPILYISGIIATALLSLVPVGLETVLRFLVTCIIFWVFALLLSKEYAPGLQKEKSFASASNALATV